MFEKLIMERIGNKSAREAILAAAGPMLQKKAAVLQKAEFHKMLGRVEARVVAAVNPDGTEDPEDVRGVVREALYHYCKLLLPAKLPLRSKFADAWRDIVDGGIVYDVEVIVAANPLEGTDAEKVAKIVSLTRDAFAERVF